MGSSSTKCMIVDADACTGCCTCELVCSLEKHGEYNPKKAFIRVLKNREMSVDIVVVDVRCDYCGRCIEWCFPRAIRIVELAEAAVIRKENRIGVFPAPMVAGGRFSV